MLVHVNLIIFVTLLSDCACTEIRLVGTGSTFSSGVIETWIPAYSYYREEFVGLDMSYDEMGSRYAKVKMKRLVNESDVDYGVTDAELTSQEMENFPDLQLIPIVAGAVVLAYNLPNVNSLVLSRQAIVGIYNGTIQRWDDPTLQEINPNETLPGESIRVVVRADYSGTTEIFTRALSTFDPEWNKTYGTFARGLDFTENPVFWNATAADLYGRTNRGMAGIVFSYRYSIGYISVAEATMTSWAFAGVINKAGKVITNMTSGIERVMNNRKNDIGDTLTGNLLDSDDPEAYPILGYSYLIIRRDGMLNCDTARALLRYIDWFYQDYYAHEIAHELGMAQITSEISEIVRERVLKQVTCRGENVYDKMLKEKRREYLSEQTWRLPVTIAVPVAVTVMAGFVIYLVYQQMKLRRALLSDEWKIDSKDIKMRWEKDGGLSRRTIEFGSGVSAVNSNSSDVSFWTNTVSKLGVWQEKHICLREFPNHNFRLTKRSTKVLALNIRNKIIHTNVLRFYGITSIEEVIYLVSDHASKGSLADVLQHNKYNFDDNFKYSMALDIAHGMEFLHGQGIIHGCLRADSCLLDNRWNIRVANWEYYTLQKEQSGKKMSSVSPFPQECVTDANRAARLKLWTAPEMLQTGGVEPNKKTDMYSMGLVMVEVFTRDDPYVELIDVLEPIEIVGRVVRARLRPNISNLKPNSVIAIIMAAWDEDPSLRPGFKHLIKMLSAAKPNKKSVIECMMETLEEYVVHLEDKVQERTAELATANQSLENLLHQILPATVANSLSKGETVEPEYFEHATIFFSDVVGFTTICASSTPMQVVTLLNDLYTAFDFIIDRLDVYKVETIGDAYMCISGLPIRNGIMHAGNIATMALGIFTAVETFEIRHQPNEKLQVRAGVHSGPVVAGVVGMKMPRYCLFGDTVNTASRMESTSLPMHIQISETTLGLLHQIGGYEVEPRGEMDIKGKGKMLTYFLKGKLVSPSDLPDLVQSKGDLSMTDIEDGTAL